jgi:hypothetical protein
VNGGTDLREVTTFVGRAAVAVTGAWAWFAAQWLTNGIAEHAHVGGTVGHHHDWAEPGLAAAGALMFVLWSGYAVLTVGDRVPADGPSLPGRRGAVALVGTAVAAYAVLELAEQLVQPEHRSAVTLLVLAIGFVLTAGTVSLAALLACALIVGIGSLAHLLVHDLRAPRLPPRPSVRGTAPRPLTSLLHATSQQRRGPPVRGLTAA